MQPPEYYGHYNHRQMTFLASSLYYKLSQASSVHQSSFFIQNFLLLVHSRCILIHLTTY